MATSKDSDLETGFDYKTPLQLFSEKKYVKICAPMVRYSKLPFRMLVRKYDCDLAFTPMIISNSFVRSIKARDSDFTTCKEDRPLIVQFAANNSQDFADAAEIVSPFADGVDLNCGCPQRWAMGEGYGACLISKPELVQDVVRQARNRVNQQHFTVSIKIRIHEDIRRTVDFCQKAEHAGASWVTVHGRTAKQRRQPVNQEAVRIIKDSVGIPVVSNGDIKQLDDCYTVYEKTHADGFMAANGLLENPAMFAGFRETPKECVKKWIDLSLSLGTSFQCFHHHLMFMLEKVMGRPERRIFNMLGSTSAVLAFLRDNYDL
ncbi:tRNA-dihydrouridine(20a/20b) synthase [NAD(P)+]-like isoform X2 [Liolophura sinensis]|uniref:tRNA-dihydrouridine(20a/20b) synthase [NAD(P)+]-like isoform X2 n=1 Tax=Liolophura sinensis TaxID=3198878 RepID=UPI003158FB28